jgi:hypothetical protein
VKRRSRTSIILSRADETVEEVAEWVLACQGIEGLTLSGGEPFQQAGDLRHLWECIKLRRPDFAIGVFSGHTLQKLVRGRWHWKAPGKDAWIKGNPASFMAIKHWFLTTIPAALCFA